MSKREGACREKSGVKGGTLLQRVELCYSCENPKPLVGRVGCAAALVGLPKVLSRMWAQQTAHPHGGVLLHTPRAHVLVRSLLLRPCAAASVLTPSGGSSITETTTWSVQLLAVSSKSKQEASKGTPKEHTPSDVFHPGPKVMQRGGALELSFTDNEDDDEVRDSAGKRLPAEMRCFDTASIYVKGGDGGNGCVAFRREKHVARGGPSGACGGRGGNVWAVADPELNSLFGFRRQVHWRAVSGENGQGKQMDGANAPDLFIPVPPGSIIRKKGAAEGEPPLAELVLPGDKALLLVGGRGGRGNFSFKTRGNNAPTMAERGEQAPEMWVDVELKVVADVGIIGVPNAGKSTLLSVVTAAKPKIADYPFTTLVPNLGVCDMDFRTMVLADVPGLLEGAHEGLGLGHEFLRHVQRCRALIHIIDSTSPDPLGDFKAINLELELFNPLLRLKPQVVAYNKVDVPDSSDMWQYMKEALLAEGVAEEDMLPVSAVTGQGVLDLMRRTHNVLDQLGPRVHDYETDAKNQKDFDRRSQKRMDDFTIEQEQSRAESSGGCACFLVQGEAIDRFAQMTNWDYYEAVKRFQRVLDVSGISGALRAKGIKEGDTVVINDMELAWSEDRSDGGMYQAWIDDMKGRGRVRQGASKWPHLQA